MENCSILRNDMVLFSEIKVADRFFTRLVGLLKTDGLNEKQGLLLKKCNQVHTFGLKFPIDVIFLSKDGDILHMEQEMGPGKVSPHIKTAYWVLELKSGSGIHYKLEINQRLVIRQ
ncbi:MAG: DUF192 domain-containing protein [Acetobacterium sp.]|uniref:DUF192 domain-containing protein n=1 Tax=Acetobacterium sp. TaxID=1872094 RepID=UPI003241DA66